eukprot:scaffold14905_cov32-Tisochrysis_lutea.AAC.4
MTASNLVWPKSFERAGRSSMSSLWKCTPFPLSSLTLSRASRLALTRESTTLTSYPCSSSSSTVCEPM